MTGLITAALIIGMATFFVWLVTSRVAKRIAREDAALRKFFEGRGFVVHQASTPRRTTRAEGSVSGLAVRFDFAPDPPVSNMPEIVRATFTVRPAAPITPTILRVRNEPVVEAGDLHEISTEHVEFDNHFRTLVEDDAAALALLNASHREKILALAEPDSRGLRSLRTGAEVSVALRVGADPLFFSGAKLSQAFDLTLSLAGATPRPPGA